MPKDEKGRFPAKHYLGLDPGLVGIQAFEHPAVHEWWRWLTTSYKPGYETVLVTPCSSVKPYTRSPTSRKIRGMLRRLGLWDPEADRPWGLDWLYLSDLLLLVPYERAEDYPACCYEVPPDLVLANGLLPLVAGKLAEAVECLVARGVKRVVVFLPRKHLAIWEQAKRLAERWPEEHQVKFSLFSLKGLEDTLTRLVGQA